MSDTTSLMVTGLSGLIGSRFSDLYAHKYSFTNLDLTAGIDITDAKAVEKAVSQTPAEMILHLAAFTDVGQAETQVGDKDAPAYQVNVVGTQNIAKAAAKHSKYLIHISTDYVFDGTKKKPYTEEDIPKPINWYGQTKADAEEVVKSTLDKQFYSIVRTSFPFRSNFPQKLDIVRKIIKGLEDNSLPPMFTDHTITPTFVDDLCKVFFMFTLKRPKGIWHATGSSWVSDFELATFVKDTFGLKGEIKPGLLEDYNQTSPRKLQKNLAMNNRKLQEELGNPMLPVPSALMIMKTQV